MKLRLDFCALFFKKCYAFESPSYRIPDVVENENMQ